MAAWDPCSSIKINKFSVQVYVIFLKKNSQYKVFENVAAYRRFWG